MFIVTIAPSYTDEVWYLKTLPDRCVWVKGVREADKYVSAAQAEEAIIEARPHTIKSMFRIAKIVEIDGVREIATSSPSGRTRWVIVPKGEAL